VLRLCVELGSSVQVNEEKSVSETHEGEVINIFSIASGHMYERLQKIMMLSVLRHTTSKVKFWLIKNYMSPEMKRMLPLMAEKYGFEVPVPSLLLPSLGVCFVLLDQSLQHAKSILLCLYVLGMGKGFQSVFCLVKWGWWLRG
jgi:hypothetical protein